MGLRWDLGLGGRGGRTVKGMEPRPGRFQARWPWRVAVVVLVMLTAFLAFSFGRAQSPAVIEEAPEADQEALSLYADALLTAREEYVDREAAEPGAMTHGAIEGMLGTLGDGGHTRFLTAEEMERTREGLSGEYVGVGVQLEEKDGGEVAVLSPLAGSPAERAGVRPGDVILKVGGWNAEGAGVDEVVARIKGPEGTEVGLSVEREAEGVTRERSFELARETIDAPAASWAFVGDAPTGGGRTAVVALSSFTEDASSELRSAFEAAEEAGAGRFVLDLRGNPGGELEEAVAAAGLFLEDGETAYVRQDAEGERQKIEARDPTPFSQDAPPVTEPLVVLVDEGSASASEILAGALKDNGRATVVGIRTAGTGTVLQEFPLRDGSSMLLGVAEWLTPKGDFIRESGIAPDAEVVLDEGQRPLLTEELRGLPAEEISREDAQLWNAIEEVRGR